MVGRRRRRSARGVGRQGVLARCQAPIRRCARTPSLVGRCNPRPRFVPRSRWLTLEVRMGSDRPPVAAPAAADPGCSMWGSGVPTISLWGASIGGVGQGMPAVNRGSVKPGWPLTTEARVCGHQGPEPDVAHECDPPALPESLPAIYAVVGQLRWICGHCGRLWVVPGGRAREQGRRPFGWQEWSDLGAGR